MKQQQVQELIGIAQALFAEGNYNAALTKLNEVDRVEPGLPQVLTIRAHIFIATGRAAEAVKVFEVIRQNFPHEADVVGELANATFFAGDKLKAYELVKQALGMDPNSTFCLEVMGRVATDIGRWRPAIEAYEKLAAKHPENPLGYWLWSNALAKVQEFDKAAKVYRRIIDQKLEPLTYEHAANIGNYYFSARRFSKAEKWYQKALELKPGDADFLVVLARCAIQRGDLKGGEALLRQALKHKPDSIYAFTLLNDIKPDEDNLETASLLEEKLESGTFENEAGKMRTHLFLGKFYHKEKVYDRAFGHFRTYNQLKHREYQAAGDVYDPHVMAGNFAETKRIFSKAGLAKLKGCGLESDLPVFIIGMPRSGTTLLEQIIATHSKVHGGGEIITMSRNFMDLNFAVNEQPDRDIHDIIRDEAKGWAEAYLKALPDTKGAVRVTDKMPVNFIYLGMVQAMFAGARVIHIRRNPLDTCLSMYSNDFNESYAYSTNFKHLGHYYNQYAGLMAHWKKTLSLKFLEINYEDLVANQEAKSREALEFCGLPWEDAVLEYYKAKKSAYTISQVQVTKPINTSGVARWKPYKKYIGELIGSLDEDIVGPLKGLKKRVEKK